VTHAKYMSRQTAEGSAMRKSKWSIISVSGLD
jgi:hypothetical protein